MITTSDHDSLTLRVSESDNGAVETNRISTAVVASKKGLKFWLMFASMCLCLFLSALDLYWVSTALPTIAHELQASQFVWVGSAYALSSTAFLPMSGGLAQVFGRRPTVLLTLGFFALGSGICGGARSMSMLVAGRTIQGLGGGGIQSLSGIILSDLVTLQERGLYTSFFWLVACLAASIGPVVGGSFATGGQWRWLFYINLPVSFVASLFIFLFLDLPTPPGNYRDKFKRLDWIGNLIVMGSTVACTIALTWGGTTSPWDSVPVLIPLIFGLVGLVGFIAYEMTIATHPLFPLALMKNATTVSGFIQSFCMGFNTMTIVYFFPVYFQACKGVSPKLSGIYTLGVCAFAPAGILTGLLVKVTGRYRPQIWIAWLIMLVTMGLLSASMNGEMDMGIGMAVGYLALLGTGLGLLTGTILYPIQAPLPVTQNAPAVAWMWFVRFFASAWGVTIGSTVLQNELFKMLPPSFLQSIPQDSGVYALIPEIATLPLQTRVEVQVAFARSLAVLWQVLAAVCAVGGVASLCMKGVALSSTLDPTWAIKRTDKEQDREAVMPCQTEIKVSCDVATVS